jgi:hypothetical protein
MVYIKYRFIHSLYAALQKYQKTPRARPLHLSDEWTQEQVAQQLFFGSRPANHVSPKTREAVFAVLYVH